MVPVSCDAGNSRRKEGSALSLESRKHPRKTHKSLKKQKDHIFKVELRVLLTNLIDAKLRIPLAPLQSAVTDKELGASQNIGPYCFEGRQGESHSLPTDAEY